MKTKQCFLFITAHSGAEGGEKKTEVSHTDARIGVGKKGV